VRFPKVCFPRRELAFGASNFTRRFDVSAKHSESSLCKALFAYQAKHGWIYPKSFLRSNAREIQKPLLDFHLQPEAQQHMYKIKNKAPSGVSAVFSARLTIIRAV